MPVGLKHSIVAKQARVLTACIEAAEAEYAEATRQGRHAFAVDALLELSDRLGLLQPAATADLLELLAQVVRHSGRPGEVDWATLQQRLMASADRLAQSLPQGRRPAA